MSRRPFSGGARLLAALAFVLAVGTRPSAGMEAEIVSGTIGFYECGDNCYLTIATGDGGELTGLCAAPECDAWNEEAGMPAHLVGQAVTVRVETGLQLDGEGNVMGEFPAFTALTFEN